MLYLKIILSVMWMLLGPWSGKAFADLGVFDDRVAYDIYFSTGSNSSTVIKNVTILRLEEIAGKTYLVIRDQGFKLKIEEGFVLLDAVVAILPERNFRVHQSQRINIQQ
jgi:hypothetical protein